MQTELILIGALILIHAHRLSAAERQETFATYRSMDQGRFWTISDGLPKTSRVNAFGSNRNALFAATDAGVFVSMDQAVHWVKPSGVEQPLVRPLCFASAGSTLFVGTEADGIMTTADYGKTWSFADIPTKRIRSLLSAQGSLLAGTDRDGIYKSEDVGKTWIAYSNGLPATGQIHEMRSLGASWYAALYNEGLYRRTPREVWHRVGTVVPLVITAVQNTLVVGHNPGGIHWSTDGGETWSASGDSNRILLDLLPPKAPVWALASSETTAIAGAADGIFISKDLGRSWNRAESGLPKASPGIAFYADEQLVLAATILKR